MALRADYNLRELSRDGADIYRIDLLMRKATRLTFQESTPNTGNNRPPLGKSTAANSLAMTSGSRKLITSTLVPKRILFVRTGVAAGSSRRYVGRRL